MHNYHTQFLPKPEVDANQAALFQSIQAKEPNWRPLSVLTVVLDSLSRAHAHRECGIPKTMRLLEQLYDGSFKGETWWAIYFIYWDTTLANTFKHVACWPRNIEFLLLQLLIKHVLNSQMGYIFQFFWQNLEAWFHVYNFWNCCSSKLNDSLNLDVFHNFSSFLFENHCYLPKVWPTTNTLYIPTTNTFYMIPVFKLV